MIDIICPSRGRPQNLERLWCEGSRLDPYAFRLHTYIDDDDPTRHEYEELYAGGPSHLGLMLRGPRIRLVPAYNRLALEVLKQQFVGWYDVTCIAFMGDDHVPRTEGWATILEEACMPMGVSYGDDTIMASGLPTAAFMDADIVRRLGYMAPPKLIHMYGDNFWRLVGEDLGKLVYRPDVVIEHVHPLKTQQWDVTTTEANAPGVWAHDTPEWERYLAEDWPIERMKLR